MALVGGGLPEKESDFAGWLSFREKPSCLYSRPVLGLASSAFLWPVSHFASGHIFFTFMSGILSYHTLVFAVRAKNALAGLGRGCGVRLCRQPPTRLKMP